MLPSGLSGGTIVLWRFCWKPKKELNLGQPKNDNQDKEEPTTILIDSRASHSYIDPKFVERLCLPRSKHEKSWLV